jgi:hypothetical protein
MARKELAGLAALGALAMMANKSKKSPDVDTSGVSDIDLTGGARTPAPTDFEQEGSRSPVAGFTPSTSVASPRIKTPVARKSPRIGGYTSDSEQIAKSRPTNPIDELNRATNTKPMDPNSDRGPNAVTGTELDRNVDNAMNAVGGSGLKVVRNLAKGLANRTGKIPEYIQPLLRGPTKYLERPKAGIEGEGFVMRKKGGEIKMAKGGMARSSASSRGDGIASKGKTRGRMC